MNHLLNVVDLQLSRGACKAFEADLSAFVDGELSGLDAAKVSAHVEECRACRAFVDSLTGMTRMHQDADAYDSLASFGGAAELWSDLAQRLLSDNQDRLGRVLYELGKALVAAGIRTTPGQRSLRLYRTRPGSLPTLVRKGKLLVRENEELQSQTPGRASSNRLLRPRRQRLFPSSSATPRGSAAFECGRRCLEESLRLVPGKLEARIYLAQYYRVLGRYDRSRQQLRAVLRADPEGRLRLITLQQLSKVYGAVHQFSRAAETEREVLERAREEKDVVFQVGALANLVIYCVKLGRWDEAEAFVADLVQSFPSHLETIVAPAFRRARDFRRCLIREENFLSRMRTCYPALFAG